MAIKADTRNCQEVLIFLSQFLYNTYLYFPDLIKEYKKVLRECLFGKIKNQKTALNEARKMNEKWQELMNKFFRYKMQYRW